MTRRITVDAALCINCKACEIHCQVWNRTPEGIKLGIHCHEGPEMQAGRPVLRVRFLACRHCADAVCIKVCRAGAMTRRSDGVVFVDASRCTGCRACVRACPEHFPQYDAVAGRVRKCELCYSRLDQGLRPVCVTGCPTGALRVEEVE